MKIRPLRDVIIIKSAEEDAVTPGGLYIPDTAKEKKQWGTILAVGPGKIDDKGTLHEPRVKVGDEVYFLRYGGQKYEIDGEEVLFVREHDLVAVRES